ncbi:nucleotidyltransferase and HEPN domain-containing protein [Agrobacterium rosae]|uniref:Nucleotidyltransferase and HEPN domain-containing protein n=1 Tax=Agrobacterium rosae TaxID=1972867 RepID=A0AAW9FJI7_9HYPH|nr:nucleotidyltransferase and HEPN domain-containing protein [Agrobacterium rosae]MDX8305584.1 nucleotidyltransferase and HEPN domain-containing protein [Agrobacterium rosae]
MRTSLDHLPPAKQTELKRLVDILHEEFDDALKGATADFKKKGRILKIMLFGSYARGTYVDEPHTKKGYRSDYDILVIVNNRKLTDVTAYWNRAFDRLARTSEISAPVSVIVHSLREVNTELKKGRYFFVEIRHDGIALYDIDGEPLAEPETLPPQEAWRIACEYYYNKLPSMKSFLDTAQYLVQKGQFKHASFELHQAVEQAYSTLLLIKTNYSPPSHNIRFLRSLTEDLEPVLIDVWPRNNQRFMAWFNILNEAYVKARYSDHYEITKEALEWLIERTQALVEAVDTAALLHLEAVKPKHAD